MSLRSRNYRQTAIVWINTIPTDWDLVRLKEVYHERDERSIGGEEELLSVSAYTGVTPRSDIIDTEDFLTRAGSLVGYKVVYKDDLVVNIMLAWNRGLGVSNCGGIVSPAYCVFKPNAKINPGFAHYALRSTEYVSYYKSYSTGVIDSRLRIYPDKFLSLSCALPSLAEQIAIASFLDRETGKIDALMAEQERLIALLKEKRQAVISQAVTKSLDLNVKMKDSGAEWLGEVPAHWEVKRLKHAMPSITVGIVVEPSKFYVEEDGIPALRSLNVRPMHIDIANLIYISEEGHKIHNKSRLTAGDIVVVRTGQPGTAAVVPIEFDGCNCIDLIVIRKVESISEEFVCWYLQSEAAIRQFAEGSGGAIQLHFNVGTAADIVLPIPPISQQREIAAFLSCETAKVDDLISAAERAMVLLRERRDALISAAVTGKIDVRDRAVTVQAAA